MSINIKIIEKHDGILNIITGPIACLVNFDFHSDYPQYSEDVIDIDQFCRNVDSAWYEHNWIAILASYGYVKEFTWIFPHDDAKEDIKVFESKAGDSIIFNKKFDPSMEITCQYITIDMDFFGSRTPINWTPKEGRMNLLKDVLRTLKSENITLIICKSNNFVNYGVDEFLQEMLTIILCK
jgi:hypothetical protein